MDSFQDIDEAGVPDASPEPMAAIGTDERRLHVLAYNAWVSLLDGQSLPSIADLDPAESEVFGPNSVLLDFVERPDDPRVAWLGGRLRAKCGIETAIATIADVPRGSLLSRLTDHHLQIIANRAPIGFEAEFTDSQNIVTSYRGILLPFTSDGTTIDFVYGVISWKDASAIERAAPGDIPTELGVGSPTMPVPSIPAVPAWADGPNAAPVARSLGRPVPNGYDAFGELDEAEDDEDAEARENAFACDKGLADQLAAARETADRVQSAEGRNRASLYRALSLAYDFSLVAEYREKEYLELLEDAGIRAHPRAHMAALVKLIFGVGCDRAQLTAFAAALSHARRLGVEPGGFATMIERQPGGLKGVVLEERKARRPQTQRDRSEIARAALRKAEARAIIHMAAGEGEFLLLMARREADGTLAVIAPVPEDPALLDRAVRLIIS